MGKNVYQKPYYVPPSTSAAFTGSCPSGQIKLFKDNNWNSQSLTIDTNSAQYPAGSFFSFSGTPLQDNATWIVFNLPENVVCTLCNNIVQNKNPYDFSGAGVCVDLIGNGKVQTIDLVAYGANDVLSGGVWRPVNPTSGWFQLFYDNDAQGTFATIFFSEWPTGSANSIAKWWLQDQGSSINFPALTPPQLLTVADNADGSGQAVTVGASNPYGTFNNPALINLGDRGLNDRVSSFSYSFISPVKVEIKSITVDVTAPINEGQTITEVVHGTNASSEKQTITDTIAANQSVAVTNTATQQYATSATVSATVEASAGVPEVGTIKSSLTTSFTVSSTTTNSQSTTTTNTFSIGQSFTFNVPPQSTYSGVAKVSIGQVPPTRVTQNGSYYYSQNLPGSVKQPDNTYLLTVPVSVVISGEVGSTVEFNIKSTPITTA